MSLVLTLKPFTIGDFVFPGGTTGTLPLNSTKRVLVARGTYAISLVDTTSAATPTAVALVTVTTDGTGITKVVEHDPLGQITLVKDGLLVGGTATWAEFHGVRVPAAKTSGIATGVYTSANDFAGTLDMVQTETPPSLNWIARAAASAGGFIHHAEYGNGDASQFSGQMTGTTSGPIRRLYRNSLAPVDGQIIAQEQYFTGNMLVGHRAFRQDKVTASAEASTSLTYIFQNGRYVLGQYIQGGVGAHTVTTGSTATTASSTLIQETVLNATTNDVNTNISASVGDARYTLTVDGACVFQGHNGVRSLTLGSTVMLENSSGGVNITADGSMVLVAGTTTMIGGASDLSLYSEDGTIALSTSDCSLVITPTNANLSTYEAGLTLGADTAALSATSGVTISSQNSAVTVDGESQTTITGGSASITLAGGKITPTPGTRYANNGTKIVNAVNTATVSMADQNVFPTANYLVTLVDSSPGLSLTIVRGTPSQASGPVIFVSGGHLRYTRVNYDGGNLLYGHLVNTYLAPEDPVESTTDSLNIHSVWRMD